MPSIETIIRQLIAEQKESVSAFNKFKQFAKREDYASAIRHAASTMDYLGSGSSRMAIALYDDRVLKIAIKKAGMTQNAIEASPQLQSAYGDIVAKVYDRSRDFFWIEQELCEPVEDLDGANKWAEIVCAAPYGAVSMYIFAYYKMYSEYQQEYLDNEEIRSLWDAAQRMDSIQDRESKIDNKVPVFQRISKSSTIQKILKLMFEYDLAPGDLVPPASSGKFDAIGFGADGRPVIMDYGMTGEVWHDHYAFNSTEGPSYSGQPHRKQVPLSDKPKKDIA